MCEISVVVPVYNVERYLNKCINTILEQTFTNFELILVDDGSKDDSGNICDEIKEKYSRIKVIHTENAGLSAARNIGIETSEGKYITFIDSDDYIHPRMLEILYSIIIENKADISLCNHQLVYDDKAISGASINNNITVYNSVESIKKIVEKGEESMIVSCSKLYKQSLFSDIRFPLGKYHEDEFVTYKILHKCTKVVATDAKLYYYFQRANSITRRVYNVKRLEKLEALEEAIKFFKDNNNKMLTYLAEFRYLFNIQIAYYRVKYEMSNNKEIMEKLKIQYDHKYIEFAKCNIKRISIIKKILLLFFYICPNIYCFLVRVCLNFGHSIRK